MENTTTEYIISKAKITRNSLKFWGLFGKKEFPFTKGFSTLDRVGTFLLTNSGGGLSGNGLSGIDLR